MAKDRARDDRRSVGSHEKMMAALGRAAESNIKGIQSAQAWKTTSAVRPTNTVEAKNEAAYHKGRISAKELAEFKVFEGAGLDRPYYQVKGKSSEVVDN